MKIRATASMLLGLLLAGWGNLSVPQAACAAQPPTTPSNPLAASLKEELEVGLKARRPEEFDFINIVLARVALQELPLDMVKSTFQWARKKRPYPFPYFERALRLRAAQKGVTL